METTRPTTPETLAALEAAEAAATPGPWTLDIDEGADLDDLRLITIPEIERTLHDDEWAEKRHWKRDLRNADLIVLLRNNAKAMCAQLRAAEALAAAVEEIANDVRPLEEPYKHTWWRLGRTARRALAAYRAAREGL